MKKIVVSSKLGKPTISTSGYDGDSCLEATRALEQTLSGEGGCEIREFNPSVGVEERNVETN